MQIKSTAFSEKERIPAKYTCDGEDVNPPLEFVGVPEDAQSIALVVDDPDSPGKIWLHWLVANIDPRTEQLYEDYVPKGAIEITTDFGSKGYGGPCPASGTHRYRFRLFALDTMLELTDDVTLDEFEQLIRGHVVAEAQLIGLYSRE